MAMDANDESEPTVRQVDKLTVRCFVRRPLKQCVYVASVTGESESENQSPFSTAREMI